MTIMKKFEIGRKYSCTGLYGGEYVIRVVGRTGNTVSFVYDEETSDDRAVRTAEVRIRSCTVFDDDLNEVGRVDSESIVAWEYRPQHAEPDEYTYGYYFAFDNDRPYTREELEALDDGSETKKTACREMILYAERKGNSQHMLQILARDILKYGKTVDEYHHTSQEFRPDGTERSIETGSYCMEVLNEITGYRYWIHFSGCRVTEIIESR